MITKELADLRAEIDKVDEELVELLSRRFRITAEVAKLKATQNMQAIDVDREAQQIQRLNDLALRYGVNPELVAHIFRIIVSDVVATHRTIAERLSTERN